MTDITTLSKTAEDPSWNYGVWYGVEREALALCIIIRCLQGYSKAVYLRISME